MASELKKKVCLRLSWVPGLSNADSEKAVRDCTKRKQQYGAATKGANDTKRCLFMKTITVSSHLILNDMQGYVQGNIVIHLTSSRIMLRGIYLSKHCESEWNATGQLKSDHDFTDKEKASARCLALSINRELTNNGNELPLV